MFTDIRHAFRVLLKTPGFTALVVSILGLGIGANTAIFSVVYAVVLQPLPFAEASRLVAIDTYSNRVQGNGDSSAYPDFADWKAQATTIERMAGYATGAVTMTGRGEAASVPTAFVTPDFLPLLGVAPIAGRTFAPSDDEKGATRVAIVSETLWQQRFARDSQLVGRALTLDGRAFTIVGVVSQAFHYPYQSDPIELWVPMGSLPFTGDFKEQRGASFMNAIGRLRPGASIEHAQAELTTIAARLAETYPRSNASRSVRVRPLHETLVQNYRFGLNVLLSAVAAVLLIACANVANLLLARSAGRHKEIGIRAALGAGRARLVRQLLTESVVLSLAAGALGLIIALWGISAIVAASPIDVPRLRDVAIDRTVLAFTALVSMATGVLFGLAPAIQLARSNAGEALKDGGRGTSGAHSARTRQILVVAEVALSLVLLTAAGLLIRSFVELRRVDPGFVPERALGMSLLLPDVRYPDAPARVAFYRRLLDATAALPGISSSAVATTLPMSGNDLGMGFRLDDRPESDPKDRPVASAFGISPDYFRTMGIPVLEGRSFTSRDDENAAPVLIVSESMAARYWPGESPLGKRVTIGYNKTGPREIVGVVRDVKQNQLSESAPPQMYAPFPQMPWPFMAVVVRTQSDPGGTAGAVREVVAALDPEQAPGEVETIERYVARSVAAPRFNATLVACFAGLALLLAGSGLYGVMAYGVEQRTREIGIRMALGAQAGDVRTMVVGQAIRIGAIGLAIGLTGALAATRVLETLLYDVSPGDPVTFVAVSALLVGVVLLAAYVPARRATRVDPMLALRSE